MKSRSKTLLLFATVLMGCGGGSGGDGTSTPPVPTDPGTAVETIPYTFTGFSRITINGSFAVDIEQGPDYKLEITIDSTEASKLDVSTDSGALNIGFQPNVDVRATTLRAVIQLPAIESITLTGSNHTTVAGFSGSSLVVALNGNNLLEGYNCNFDFVNATVVGSSLFEFAGVSAIATAHAEIAGSSTATLNLMDAATLTGFVMGTSSLLYYGSDIAMQVDVAPSANVTRLGNSR